MRTFIVKTENFLARKLTLNALKQAMDIEDNEILHGLYQKACMKTDVIVISSIPELEMWSKTISAYNDTDGAHGKILRVMKSYAKCGLEKRLNEKTNAIK